MSYVLFLSFFMHFYGVADVQESGSIKARVVNARNSDALTNAVIYLEGYDHKTTTSTEGTFQINEVAKGQYILNISKDDFSTKRIPISIGNTQLDLGKILLEEDFKIALKDNLITLTDAELFDDEVSSSSTGLLQATKDIFLNRAAFDFGQAFFRVRGYDAKHGKILVNGIPMNKFYDGRPQWNNWGGLNDATRSQQFTLGLASSNYAFGGILGTTNIDMSPSALRPGTKMSASISNRTYANRLMFTHTSSNSKNNLTYSFSASRRWAKQGYIEGTLYDAFSIYSAVAVQLNEANNIQFTGVYASNRRGRSSAITEEVFDLVGKKYNPYWGEQDDKIRNSRERKIAEPLLILNHKYTTEKFKLQTGLAYQFGINARSRLGYYNAPNPDPTYYRYLPSFYINSAIGANFIGANTAREGFLKNPQLNWSQIYLANQQEKAAYVLYDDVVDNHRFMINSIANMKLSSNMALDFGAGYSQLNSNNYAKISDLLGATFHEDIDPFSNTKNDTNGVQQKFKGNIFNYNYEISASEFEAFAQMNYAKKSWEAFIAGSFKNTSYERNGIFKNERYIENSLGRSSIIKFDNWSFKTGSRYHFNGRHSLAINGAIQHTPPVLQNVFINPRENNQEVNNLQNEKITTFDLNYNLRLSKLVGRLTGYYTRFQDATDVNFFFVDSGVGSDFVQEVLTDLDYLHLGLELGLEYQLSSTVQLTGVAAIGKHVYASNPNVAINFDTAGAEEELIHPLGTIDLGPAYLKNYKRAQGPQQAYALGVNYRDPKYWWIGVTANYLTANYANVSSITRTSSFYVNPETGVPFPDATDENVNTLLRQDPLDSFYLLNLVGGKSWLKKGKYISIFASINNAFDAVYRTGGYEQSRNGNFGQLRNDNLSGTPSFAPKFWYGYGRTYFVNLAFSF